MKSKIHTMLHPIRMRIMHMLLRKKELTVLEIGELIPDVPQATLYRHIQTLYKEEIIFVVREHRVRGTIEKTYALSYRLNDVTKEELKHATTQDHFSYFFSFVMNLLSEYEAYLAQDEYDCEKDGISFRQLSLYLSDEELVSLLKQSRAVVSEYMKHGPQEGRRLRTISTIVIPQSNHQESSQKGE